MHSSFGAPVVVLEVSSAESTADLARVLGEVVGDLVEAEAPQDRGGRLAFQEEPKGRPHEFIDCHVLATERGGKTPGHAHDMLRRARTVPYRDAESAVGLLFHRDLTHVGHANRAVTVDGIRLQVVQLIGERGKGSSELLPGGCLYWGSGSRPN